MCAKNHKNPTMLSRVTAKNVGDVFCETQYGYMQATTLYSAGQKSHI